MTEKKVPAAGNYTLFPIIDRLLDVRRHTKEASKIDHHVSTFQLEQLSQKNFPTDAIEGRKSLRVKMQIIEELNGLFHVTCHEKEHY